ncbi:MAG: transposase family protein [Rickettsiales bacterium]|nr:transposase family protein [Rickettsiales bacterium]
MYVAYPQKSTFTSQCCQEDNCIIHSRSPRIWRTLDIMNYRTYIHLDVPKSKCPKCGKTTS